MTKMEAAASSAMSVTIYRYKRLPPQQKKKLKLTLEQATKAQRRSRGIALLFL
jgi:hypothetical protein